MGKRKLRAGVPVNNIAARIESEGDEILKLAIQIANDVIPFDAHNIFFSWKDLSESLWYFPTGFHDGRDFDALVEESRKLDSRLGSRQNCQFAEDNQQTCLVRIRLPQGVGCLAVERRRDERDSGRVWIDGDFSECEVRQLECVSTLIRSAFKNKKSLQVLRRLHLNFLHGRTLLQEAESREILNEYLLKAAHVCHDLAPEDFESTHGGVSDAVRLTAKLINDNGMALEIAACKSTDRNEWTEERKKTLYRLPEGSEEAESITANVFQSQIPHRTNKYVADKPNKIRIFSDTKSHLSVPIVAGRGTTLGVLSCEATIPKAYNKTLSAAFSLLAGHLAWPLGRAMQRQEFSEIERAFADELWHLRGESREERLFDALRETLLTLGYPRGMISKVDFEKRSIVGEFCWGGTKIERVKELTRRDFDNDRDDCQVLAIRDRQPQVIRDPGADPRANNLVVQIGDLKPFAVYPIHDNHGRPLWTLHVERRDGVSLSKTDERRILPLCTRIMKAREESRRTRFEHTWYQEMLRTSFYSFRDLLSRFADCIVAAGIVVRCRIFLVDETGHQTPFYQAGVLKSNSFSCVSIDERDIDIRDKTVPILCVRDRHKSDLSNGDDSEFIVLENQVDPHLKELQNGNRSQWVEAPVRFEKKTVAKLVLDHSIASTDDYKLKIGKDDAFTLGEMRLIGRLTRILGIAAEVADAYRMIAALSCAGINGKLISHFFGSSTSTLFKMVDLPLNVEEEVEKIRECFEAFEGLLGDKPGNAGASKSERTIGSELAAAFRAIKPISSGIELPKIDASQHPQKVKVANGDPSLFLAFVTLLENCVKYIKKARENEQQGESIGKIEVGVDTSGDQVTISVSDNGIGIDERRAHDLSQLFADPARYLPWEGGLAYLAFLAKENKWILSLDEESTLTTFKLTVYTQDAME